MFGHDNTMAIADAQRDVREAHLGGATDMLVSGARWIAVRRRRPEWRRRHARSMLWSFVGLLAAAASEAIVRIPGLVADWAGIGIAVGGMLNRRTVSRIA